MQKPTVNVVVLNYNTKSVLQQCLPNVVNACQLEGVTVTVADNASGDGSADWVAEAYPEVKLIRLSENTGYAGGYNRALAGLKEDYFVLLNSDAEFEAGWLAPMLACAEADPTFGAAQPHILDYFNRNKFEYAGAGGGFMDAFAYPFCRGRIFGLVETNTGQYDTQRQIFWATGAALFIKRTAWEQAGGLDEAFFAHMEEIDLCWRLHLLGYSVYSVPASKVYHMGGATLANQSPRKTFLNFRNNLLLMHKNMHPAEKDMRIFQRKLLDALAGIFFALKFQFSLIPPIIKAHREFDKIKKDFTLTPNPKLVKDLPGTIPHSIVFGYFLRRKITWKTWFD